MTILIVHNEYKIHGGEDAVFENESAELEKRGHRVIRYIRKNSETDDYGFFRKIGFLFSSIHNEKTINDVKKILAAEKIDIAHIHNTFPLISPSIYRIMKKEGIKTVQTIHNFRFLCPNGLFFRNGEVCTLCKNRRYFNSVRYRCYRNSFIDSLLYYMILTLNKKVFSGFIDGYIALTGFAKGVFTSAGFDEKKIFIKGNGFADNAVRRRTNGGYYYYFGRISEEKGIGFLLENFSKSEFKLIISGTGEKLGFYRKKYAAFENIKFTGFLDLKGINEHIACAISVIVPSLWYENYPMAIVESFRTGIPVIATDIGSIPHIIEDGVSGLLFERGNGGDFMKKIVMMADNGEMREQLGDGARAAFEQKMEFSINMGILEDIYKRVLNG